MSDRSDRISKLLASQKSRASYIKAKLGVLVPAQIRALRLKSTNPPMPYQRDLGEQAEMHQSRISMFETPGMANMTLETLSKVAAALKVGLRVEFVPFSKMLKWENDFSQDAYDVTRLELDVEFIDPDAFARARQSQSLVENIAPLGPMSASGQLVPLSSLLGTQESPLPFSTAKAVSKSDQIGAMEVPDFGQIVDKFSTKVSGKVIPFKRRKRAARPGKQRRRFHGRTREERRAATVGSAIGI